MAPLPASSGLRAVVRTLAVTLSVSEEGVQGGGTLTPTQTPPVHHQSGLTGDTLPFMGGHRGLEWGGSPSSWASASGGWELAASSGAPVLLSPLF